MTSFLGLQSNQLTGEIPSEFGLMTGVTYSFSLHSNDLCGAIPAEVATLSSSSVTGGWDITTDTFVGPTPCPAVSALVALYEGTGGSSDGWTVDTNWMGDPAGKGDPCTTSWYGVTCSSAGEVTRLFLDSNNVSRSLPTELGMLTALTKRFAMGANGYTSTNKISGTLPSQLGKWTAFGYYFYVGGQYLTGSIPTEFGEMTLFTHDFVVWQNDLTSTIPSELGKMTGMTHGLYLNGNSMTGSVPSELGALTDITTRFYLNGNSFCSDIPTEVAALSSQVSNWDITTGNSLGTDCST